MRINVPVYVEQLPGASAAEAPSFRVRALFFPEYEQRDAKLSRALNRLARDVRKALAAHEDDFRHDDVIAWTLCPELHTERVKLELELRRATEIETKDGKTRVVGRSEKCQFLMVAFEAFGRRVAFTPSLPEVWFDLLPGQTLEARAHEVFGRHFRRLEKEQGDDFVTPEECGLHGSAWVTTIDVGFSPARAVIKKPEAELLEIMAGKVASGQHELARVGRCLDDLYPDDLQRAVQRDTEVAELTRLLSDGQRRPVLLVGPRLVGKTAVIHEFVFRRSDADVARPRRREKLWLLSPQRLISGMSYVGQWERRLLATLEAARSERQTLYFDDLVGLFRAGQTCQSNLGVAHVLKPWLERREVQFLAEITPAALRVLRELDRGFADLFHILRVDETNEVDTVRVLIDALRRLEAQHRCTFDLDVVPTVLELVRRYVSDGALPGTAVVLAQQLAAKHPENSIGRAEVLAEFRAKSGLVVPYLDGRQRLKHADVRAALSKRMIGQEEALTAAADALCVARARLSDPNRPVASLLFLGPTGVGKTECAKAIAEWLMADADRLVRFDMNEYVGPDAVARLVGTFQQPEGLLTAAIRRQPFCVLLLDEIEKAHPDVFDLLLQVLGEGRLTDALGRTVDFTNTLIVMTSNLGARQATSGVGFKPSSGDEGAVYRHAAERFFRPEFLNRIDRLVPFEALSREQVGRIAHLLMRDVFAREGFAQRRFVLNVHPAALERVIDRGFHPQLGARALKRTLERELTQPVAARLAGLPHDAAVVVDLYARKDEMVVRTSHLVEAKQTVQPSDVLDQIDPHDALKRVARLLMRLDDDLDGLRPDGVLPAESLTPSHRNYFLRNEAIRCLRQRLSRIQDELTSVGDISVSARVPNRRTARTGGIVGRGAVREMFAAQDIRQFLDDLSNDARADAERPLPVDIGDETHAAPSRAELRAVWHAALVLDASITRDLSTPPHRDVLCCRLATANREDHDLPLQLWDIYQRVCLEWQDPLWHSVDDHRKLERLWLGSLERTAGRPDDSFKLLDAPSSCRLLKLDEGTHLVVRAKGNIVPVYLHALPVANDDAAESVCRQHLMTRDAWIERWLAGEASDEADPLPPGPVIRIYHEGGGVIDLRTGRTAPRWDPTFIARCMTSLAPLPPELQG